MIIITPVLVPLLLVVATVAGAPPPSCLRPPVSAPVVDGFRPPACPWCPGNRGLEYAAAPGAPVRAAAAGTVTFSGAIAGAFFLVLEHADGLRATYGRLSGSDLATGDHVAAGAVVGRSSGGLYFGLRRGDRYVDPTPLIGRLVTRPRLVPVDGTPARPAPPPQLRCPTTT